MLIAKDSFAVITGAGKGLGKAFAEELAGRGINVILVSLPDENLSDVCSHLSEKYGIIAKYYECTLNSSDEINDLVCWIRENFKVSILINNAGVGGTGKFHQLDIAHIDNMILLNIRATTWLIHKLLPLLEENEESYILNVSSMASFSPIGYKSVYAASKVYIEYLSKGLDREFRELKIHVASLHPGPIPTSESIQKRLNKTSNFGKMGTKSASFVAKKAIQEMFAKKKMIVVGSGNKFHLGLMSILPPKLVTYILTKGIKRELDI